MAFYTSHLDWLQVTFPRDFGLDELRGVCGDYEPLPYGYLGYKSGFRFPETGTVAYTNGSEQMGVFVLMSGDPLKAIRDRGVTDQYLCEFAMDRGGKSSRIDLTVNVINSELTVKDAVNAWEQKKLKSSARHADERRNLTKEGHTLYIGSWDSARMGRIYDKLGDLQVKDWDAYKKLVDITSWLRFEVRAKDDRARGYQGAVAQHPDTGEVIKTAVREFIQWDDPTYQAAVTGEHVNIDPIPRKPSNFERWLRRQVIPASVRNELELGQDTKALFSALFDELMTTERPKYERRQAERRLLAEMQGGNR
jgi:DNA relaxase NicK